MKIRQKGFTLIELVVVTAIILGVTGMGTVSYLDYNEKQTLEQAALTIKNNLNLARQNAIARVKNQATCTSGRELTGWCFSPDSASSGNQYKIYGTCVYPGDFKPDAPDPGNEPLPTPGVNSVKTFTQYSDEEQIIDLPRGTSLSQVNMQSGGIVRGPGVAGLPGGFYRAPLGSVQRVMFTPDGAAYIRITDALNNITYDSQTENRPTEMYYCLTGSFPSLGSNNIYRIRITSGGEIIDEGFQNACQ